MAISKLKEFVNFVNITSSIAIIVIIIIIKSDVIVVTVFSSIQIMIA